MNHLDHEHHDDPALRAIERRLGESAARYASERPGLADRVFAASAPRLGRGLAVPESLPFPSPRRWALAAAAAVAAAVSVALVVSDRGAVPARSGVVAASSPELSPAGGSEALLVALIDEDAALRSADGRAIDAGAVPLMSGRSADDVTIELDELLAAGGGR